MLRKIILSFLELGYIPTLKKLILKKWEEDNEEEREENNGDEDNEEIWFWKTEDLFWL